MMSFLVHFEQYIEAVKITVKKKPTTIFGSYSFRIRIIEERLKGMIENLGYDVEKTVCVETTLNIKNSTEEVI